MGEGSGQPGRDNEGGTTGEGRMNGETVEMISGRLLVHEAGGLVRQREKKVALWTSQEFQGALAVIGCINSVAFI